MTTRAGIILFYGHSRARGSRTMIACSYNCMTCYCVWCARGMVVLVLPRVCAKGVGDGLIQHFGVWRKTELTSLAEEYNKERN